MTFKHATAAGRDQFPASLGAKLSDESISVVFATDASFPIALSNDTDYGTPGANTLRTAAMLGLGSTAVSNANPVPVSDAGASLTIDAATLPLPTGAATEATLSAISAQLPATLGQKTMANSFAVVLASDQTAIPVSQSGTWNITNITGTVSLPTGAATEATLSSLNGKVANNYGVATGAVRTAAQIGNATAAADFNTGTVSAQTLRTTPATNSEHLLSQRHEASGTPLSVRVSKDGINFLSLNHGNDGLRTSSILGTSGGTELSYDTGASNGQTLRTVLATRHEAVATPLAAQLSNGTTAIAYDSGASSSATIRTVLATRHEAAATPVSVRISDGSAFSTPAPKGRAYSDSARNVYSTTNVTTGAWVQLIASTAAEINSFFLFDSSGQTLELGTGAAAAETRKLIIPPGGIDGPVSLNIPAGTRLSLRAISATASSGELDFSGYL